MDISQIVDLRNTPLQFPLKEYGYTLGSKLNNSNRWHTKLVGNIFSKDGKRFVSITYKRPIEYRRLIETTELLKHHNKLAPKIIAKYP